MYKTTDMRHYLTKEEYIVHECSLLKQFDIKITDEIKEHLSDLYPNECALGNYERTLIKNRLEK